MTGAEMGITVAVPTFRRPLGLGRLLDALSCQADPGTTWEVLVVDNDDAPGSMDVFRRWAEASPVPSQHVHEPRRGSGHARNRAIAEARGEVIVFVDDDVVPPRDWLSALVSPVLAGRCDGAGGPVVLDPDVPRPGWLDEEGLGGYLARFDLGGHAFDLRPDDYLVTANLALRRSVLLATDGFDPVLGPQGGQQMGGDDVLLCRRFMAAGGSLRYVPDAAVVHELPAQRLRPSYLVRRAFGEGRSEWMLERDTLSRRRFGGARVTLSWLRSELGLRARQGLWRPPIAFHALCDVSRTLGSLRGALALSREIRRPR